MNPQEECPVCGGHAYHIQSGIDAYGSFNGCERCVQLRHLFHDRATMGDFRKLTSLIHREKNEEALRFVMSFLSPIEWLAYECGGRVDDGTLGREEDE